MSRSFRKLFAGILCISLLLQGTDITAYASGPIGEQRADARAEFEPAARAEENAAISETAVSAGNVTDTAGEPSVPDTKLSAIYAETIEKTYHYEQIFDELGIRVTLSAEPGVIPAAAETKMDVAENGSNAAGTSYTEAELLEAVCADDGCGLALEDMYRDLQVSVKKSYLLNFAVSYTDPEGNPHILTTADKEIHVLVEKLDAEEISENCWTEEQLLGAEEIKPAQDQIDHYQAQNDPDGNAVEAEEGDPASGDAYVIVELEYYAAASDAMIAAEEKAWSIINTYADTEYFLQDPYRESMTDAQYQELKNVALQQTAGCATPYEKIKKICAFVADRTYYDRVYYNDRTQELFYYPYDVYVQKRTVCAGYARLVRTLLVAAGIPCMDIIGDDHEYNAAYDSVNRRWVFLDATWCSLNKYDGNWNYKGFNYSRFDLSPSQIAALKNHETYDLDGLLYNNVYYRVRYTGDWSARNWWLEVSGTKGTNVTVASGFAGLTTKSITPLYYGGYPYYYGLYNWDKLQGIDLSSTGMTSLTRAAFEDCLSLTTVKLPSCMQTIEERAFKNCKQLKEINISDIKLKEIGRSAFYNCASLEALLFPGSLETIGDYAFSGCDKLQEIRMPASVKEIGSYAFYSTGKPIRTVVITSLSKETFDRWKYLWGSRDVTICTYLYYVDFDGNGATSGTAGRSCFGGNNAYEFDAQGFKRTGYSFAGWNSQADGSGTLYRPKEKYKDLATSDGAVVKLYAQWTPNKYAIQFDGNGHTAGVMSGMTGCSYDKTYTLSQNAYTRDGYEFECWNTKEDGSGQTFEDKAGVKNLSSEEAGEVVLYAQWKEAGYTITYRLEDGTNNRRNPGTYNISSATIVLADPTRRGYSFDGWYQDSSCKTRIYEIARGSIGDIVLYAKWKPIQYTIRFDGNGAEKGSMSALQDCRYGTEYILTANKFKRPGYAFVGWNTKANGSGNFYRNTESVHDLAAAEGEAVTLYAQWKAGVYTIDYYLNGGSNHEANPDWYDEKSGTITLKAPVRAGYVFDGWYCSSKFKEKNRLSVIPAGSSGNKKFYAKWIANKYSVRLVGNGGSSVTGVMADLMNRTYGKKFTLPANKFKKAGYVFAGWNTEADGSGISYRNKAKVKNLTADENGRAVLYAQWEMVKYKITYKLNGAKKSNNLNPSTYTAGTPTFMLSAPTRQGYYFEGWYSDSKFRNRVNMITRGSSGKKTFYAKWRPYKYTVRFDGNGATGGEMADWSGRSYGKSYTLTANQYRKADCLFVGWNTEPDGSGKSYPDRGTIKNLTKEDGGTVTLYAQWIWDPFIYWFW